MCVAPREGARKLAIYGGHEDGRGAHGEPRGGRFVGNLLTPPDLAKHTHSLPTETFHPLNYHQWKFLHFYSANKSIFILYSFYAFYTCIIKPIRQTLMIHIQI